MVAKPITRLIDEAIIPALLLILAKIIGLFLASYFGKWQLETKTFNFLGFFPSIVFKDPQAYIKAENYSNLAMFTMAAIGCVYVLVKAHFFHETHIAPRVHAKLASLNLEKFISSSYHLYHQAVIWLIFLWLTTSFLILSSISGVTYAPISAIAFILSANFTWVFAVDIQKEIELAKE